MGNTVCNFNLALGKQPYELLVLGSVLNGNEINIPDGKLLMSVPSAVHSHKPPLTGKNYLADTDLHEIIIKLKFYKSFIKIVEVMKEYLPNEPKCLEIFARYLLPKWTSWGLEVLKFQHLSLYTIIEETKEAQNSNNVDVNKLN